MALTKRQRLEIEDLLKDPVRLKSEMLRDAALAYLLGMNAVIEVENCPDTPDVNTRLKAADSFLKNYRFLAPALGDSGTEVSEDAISEKKAATLLPEVKAILKDIGIEDAD